MSAATSTILAIAGIGMAGAETAGQMYLGNKAANTAKSVGKMQADAANQAGDRQTAAMNQAMDFTRQNMAQMQQSYQPSIQMGNNALSMIGQHTGMPNLGGGGMPSMSGGGMPPSGAGAPTMSPSSGPYNFLQPQLSGGQRSVSGPSMSAPGGAAGAAPGMSSATPAGAPGGDVSGRQIGEIKVFPNGNRGRWDGTGWMQI